MLYDVIYLKHIKFCFCHCYQWLIFVLFKKDYQQDDDTMLQAAIKASMEQM